MDQLIAPIEDPLEEFDGHSILNQFSMEHNGEFSSEAQEDEEAHEIHEDATTMTEHCQKRVKVQKPSNNFSSNDGGKAFLRQNAAKNRLRKHRFSKLKPNEKFRCEVCGRCFHSNTNLSVHFLVHTGERPNKCSFCGKASPRKEIYKLMNASTEEKDLLVVPPAEGVSPRKLAYVIMNASTEENDLLLV